MKITAISPSPLRVKFGTLSKEEREALVEGKVFQYLLGLDDRRLQILNNKLQCILDASLNPAPSNTINQSFYNAFFVTGQRTSFQGLERAYVMTDTCMLILLLRNFDPKTLAINAVQKHPGIVFKEINIIMGLKQFMAQFDSKK